MNIHLEMRCRQRGFTDEDLDAILQYGRETFNRGAILLTIGKQEIKRAGQKGRNISHLDGATVVQSLDSGEIITVYRNKELTQLRDRGQRRTSVRDYLLA